MKLWNAYSSEHSMNLVMIGRFKDVGAAEAAKDAIEELQSYFTVNEPEAETYSEDVMEMLSRLKTHSIGPSELEQFRNEFRVSTKQENVVITTDEIEVSAIWKLLLERGAKIEMFSAHDHEQTSQGHETQ